MKKECYIYQQDPEITGGCANCRHYRICWCDNSHVSRTWQDARRLLCMFKWMFIHLSVVFGVVMAFSMMLVMCSCSVTRDFSDSFSWQRDTLSMQSILDDSLSFRSYDWQYDILRDRYRQSQSDATHDASSNLRQQHDRSVITTTVTDVITTTLDSLGQPVVTQTTTTTTTEQRDLLTDEYLQSSADTYSTKDFWHTIDSISRLIHATQIEIDRMHRQEANARYDSLSSSNEQRTGDAARSGWQTLSRAMASWQWGVSIGILICIILIAAWKYLKRVG